VNETCWVTRRESEVYCLRWNLILESNPGQQFILTHRLPRGASSSLEGHGQRWTKQKKNQSARNPQGKGGGGVELLIEHSHTEGRNGK
jgi:hypothetical protein